MIDQNRAAAAGLLDPGLDVSAADEMFTPEFDSSGAGSPAPARCIICDETRRRYLFIIHGMPIAQCPGCGLISVYPQPQSDDISAVYAGSLKEQDPRLLITDSKTESEAARRYRRALQERGVESRRLLLIAPPGHPFATQAPEKGFDVQAMSIAAVENDPPPPGEFDAALVLYQLEKAACPLTVMRHVHAALRPGGTLLLTIPSADTWPARWLGPMWTEWRPENRFYFDRQTTHSLLLKAGFAQTWIESDRRIYTLSHIYDRAASFPKTLLTRLVKLAYHLTPRPARRLRLRVSTSGIIVTARKSQPPRRRLCSIIVPVYNEKTTFPVLMNALLAKRIPGAQKEIILVESNSTDGTRELARGYADHPEVRLILQDRPRGKGHAVRTGLAEARGEVVTIQDADLEYDLNDYDALVEPLFARRAMFVLGARHGGSFKMRRFRENEGISTIMNFGHVFFTMLINVLYRQRLKDPFTMFKLVQRDCLYGLAFECNRFDFDHELVIKLVRKGYRPLEIPVNYVSRSFSEGKKVSFFKDPLTWLWVDLKNRVIPLRPIFCAPENRREGD